MGDLTPAQLLECVDLFAAMHGAAARWLSPSAGLRELNRTFKHAPKDIRREIRDEYRTVAEPVRSTAATLAVSSIRRIGPELVADANRCHPNTRLCRTRRNAVSKAAAPIRGRRPNLGTLLAERALEPALEQNRHRIEADFDRMLDRLVTKWDHDGP